MILDIGEKVLVIERAYFHEDLRRHFIGEIKRCTNDSIRAKGYTYVWDSMKGIFVRKPEDRERVIFAGEGSTIFVIPREVDVDTHGQSPWHFTVQASLDLNPDATAISHIH